MNFKICRQLIHEDFRKVLTQQPHGKISEYLYILRYLLCLFNQYPIAKKGIKKLIFTK